MIQSKGGDVEQLEILNTVSGDVQKFNNFRKLSYLKVNHRPNSCIAQKNLLLSFLFSRSEYTYLNEDLIGLFFVHIHLENFGIQPQVHLPKYFSGLYSCSTRTPSVQSDEPSHQSSLQFCQFKMAKNKFCVTL